MTIDNGWIAKTLIKATPQQQSSEDSRISCTPESVKIWNTKQKNSKLTQDDREKKDENSDDKVY